MLYVSENGSVWSKNQLRNEFNNKTDEERAEYNNNFELWLREITSKNGTLTELEVDNNEG
jgi:hypothetical protein